MPVLNTEALINNRVEAIRAYHEKSGIERAELDVSGGIDSAVMLVLLAEALGPDNVTAVYSSIHSSEASLRRARLVAEVADVRLIELDLGKVYDDIALEAMRAVGEAGYDTDEIAARMGDEDAVAGSLRSCLRAPVGRYLNRMTGGGIRHGTGNEDEDRWLRFYQKGGDGEVDTNPLAMLSKGEVYQLANAMNVPREIIEALPTPDLWGTGEKHNDEDELTRLSGGVEWTYSRIDPHTGEYTRVGTIERMSRFLDLKRFGNIVIGDNATFESLIFSELELDLDAATLAAEGLGLTRGHLESARKWGRITRHKMNPNCPTLGSRKELLDDNILTNTLPKL
jgi:NAD+ synthase